ncbi:MAG: magnesium transporter [Planctomycetota bacterium]|nr:magnesium transporter [Planctomycetota bacterium]
MGGIGGDEEVVKRAVPLADLSGVEEALQRRDPDKGPLVEALRKVRPADVGREFSRYTVNECRRVLEAVDDRRGAAMLRSAHPTVAAQVLLLCDREHAARMLRFLHLDVQTAILGTLEPEQRLFVGEALTDDERRQVERLLSHGETAVGRLMTPKVWAVEQGKTAGEAMAALRERHADVEVAANCYVLDAERRVVGVVPLREVSIAPPEAKLDDLMTRDVLVVNEHAERGDAAEIIITHNFLSLPVVDDERRLVGAVTVDDLLDAALAHVGTGLLNQGGVAGKVAAALPYFQTPITRVVRSRVTWLVLLFVAETATGTVLRAFEHELDKHVALAFFIPLLIGTGGNAGSQTVSTIIRALALGEIVVRDALRVLWKEVSTGFVLGVLLGAIAYGRALMWGVGGAVAASVALTILVVCTWANLVGSVIPIGAQRLGIDPTVISGPLITTLVDATGLLIYLTIAMTILGMTAQPV